MSHAIHVVIHLLRMALEELGLEGRRALQRRAARKRILQAMSLAGECRAVETYETVFPILQCGDTRLGDPGDPRSLEDYFSAFQALRKAGHVESLGGDRYRLSPKGAKILEALER